MTTLSKLIAFAFLLASGYAMAYQAAPSSGTMKVTSLLPRNYGETVSAGTANQGFYFGTDTSVSGISCVGGSTSYFAIPKTDPSNSSVDNPAYRDSVNAIMLAYTLGKSVTVYVDGCINTNIPRVVGIDVL